MSGARYSNHLFAEEAAGSLEALIRDYEGRGRRLRVRRRTSSKQPANSSSCLLAPCQACQQALLQARDQVHRERASPRRSRACIAATAAATAATAAATATHHHWHLDLPSRELSSSLLAAP